MKTLVEFAAEYLSNQADRRGHLSEAWSNTQNKRNQEEYEAYAAEHENGSDEIEKAGKDHYDIGGERGGILFTYRHGDKYCHSAHEETDTKDYIHKVIRRENPHLSIAESKKSANIIHRYLQRNYYQG